MGRKYVKQVNNQNFIYPNNYLAEYDIELVQDINENSIYGALSFFSGTSTSSTGITFNYTYVWEKNGAEPFISDNGRLNLVSVHMMAPPQKFYKPWRLVDYQYTTNTGSTSATSGVTFTVLPSDVGLTQFTNGTYYFEFRFIGHRMIYPICQTLEISTITPPPTPTPTGPPPTPTLPPPTVTPTPTPPPSYTTGATLNVTDPGWIKYNMASGSTYEYIGSTGTVVLTNCLDCSTIMIGIPFADVAVFTITNCGNSCTPPPPTPTPTPSVFKSLEIYIRDIDGSNVTTLFYSKNGGGNINVPGATGTFLPTSCTYVYTITGLTVSDSITFGTSSSCVMNGNGSSSSCPFSSGSATTFTYVIDAPTVQQVALTVDTGFIP